MKRTSKPVFMVLLSFFILFLTFSPVNATSSSLSNNSSDFEVLQDKISETLTLVSDRYVFDEAFIKNLVFQFDVESFNAQYGLHYTNQSLFDSIINEISEYRYSNQITMRSTYCNTDKEVSGWNYTRTFASKKSTNYYITSLRNYAKIIAAAGATGTAITAPVPPLDIFEGAIGTLGYLYYDSFADWLAYNNDKSSGCGTIFDINKFTFVYTIWNQIEFN